MSPPIDWNPLWVSLRIALCSTLCCLILGVPLAWALSRRRLPARPLWEGLVLLPLVLPPTALGYYLLVGLGHDSLPGKLYHRLTGSTLVFTWQGAAFAVSVVSLPLLVRTLQSALVEIDPELLDAARLDGASEARLLRAILLPLAKRGLWAGIGLAFARSLGDFGVTLMVGGNISGINGTHSLSLAIYDAFNAGDDHTALIFVLLLSAICLLFSLGAAFLATHRTR